MPGRILNDKQVRWAFEKHCERYTLQEVADALFVNITTIKDEFKRNKLKRTFELPKVYSPDEEVPIIVKYPSKHRFAVTEHQLNWAYYHHWNNCHINDLADLIGVNRVTLSNAFKRHNLKVRYKKIMREPLTYDFSA